MIHAALEPRSAWQGTRALVLFRFRETLRPARPGHLRERPARRVARTPVEAGRAASRRAEVAGAGAPAGPPPPGRDPSGGPEAAPATDAPHVSGAAERPTLSRRPPRPTGLIRQRRVPVSLAPPGMMRRMARIRRPALLMIAALLSVPTGATGQERPGGVSPAATLTVLSVPVERVGAGSDRPA